MFGIILISACTKYAPLEEKDMIEDGPAFSLKNGDSSNFDGNNDDEDDDGITDPDDDDDEVDTDSDGITDPDDDDDDVIPGFGDNGKSSGGDGDSGGKDTP